MFKKEFNTWISRNFKGLSAYTLYQLLVKFVGFSTEYADEIVYVKLYDYFTNKNKDSNNTQLFFVCKEIVTNYNWL